MPPDAHSEVQEGECPVCEGEGQVLAHMAITSLMPRADLVKCPACHGIGTVDPSWPEPLEDLYREAKAEET